MRVISFVNLKGGVAKTTSVINTAAILARIHSKRVLVVDADSQCNTTDFLGDRKSTRLNSSHITRSRMPSSA